MKLDKSMKEKIKKYWWVIIILLIVGGTFYWFQWRPSQIYSTCHKQAQEKAQSTYEKRYPYEKEKIEEGWYVKDDYEMYYKQCLRAKGFNK